MAIGPILRQMRKVETCKKLYTAFHQSQERQDKDEFDRRTYNADLRERIISIALLKDRTEQNQKLNRLHSPLLDHCS